MLGMKEPEPENKVAPKSFKEIIHVVFGTHQLRLVILFDSLFAVATVSLHYYTIYMTGTMGFKYSHLTLVAIFHAAFRAIVSPFLGKFADKGSSILVACIAGGSVVPLAYGFLKVWVGGQAAYWIGIPCFAFILFYAYYGYKMKGKVRK
jgi:fucose permease